MVGCGDGARGVLAEGGAGGVVLQPSTPAATCSVTVAEGGRAAALNIAACSEWVGTHFSIFYLSCLMAGRCVSVL